MFQSLTFEKGIEQWNSLALNQAKGVNIAHNPALYYFYTKKLKLPAHYLFLKKDRAVEGLFSFVKTDNLYISMPHFSYGGIFWLDGKKSIAEPVLIEKLLALIEAEKVDSGFYEIEYRMAVESKLLEEPMVEIRNTLPLFGAKDPDKVVNLISFKEIDQLELEFFDQNLRRKIQKASKEGLEVIRGGLELIDDFSLVYNKNMLRMGSPTLGKKYFEQLIATVGINAEVFVAYQNKKPIGGAFSMWYGGYYENTWFSTLAAFNKFYTSYLLHWEMMKSAFEKGVSTYSMGRSTINSGTHRYKQQWPTDELMLYFSTNCGRTKLIRKMSWAPKIWKLLPEAIANRLGPVIAKRIY